MHLLAAKPGGFNDEEGIIDLEQSPGDIIFLSAQDSTLGLIAELSDEFPDFYPEIRLANFMNLAKPSSYDLYENSILQHSKLIILSLLGGANYWRYGIDRLISLAKLQSITLIVVPGDDQPDDELFSSSTCSIDICLRVWRYLREGGIYNIKNLFRYLIIQHFPDCVSTELNWLEPKELPICQILGKNNQDLTLNEWKKINKKECPVSLLILYRAHIQSGNIYAFREFVSLLEKKFNVLAIAIRSLKDMECISIINHIIDTISCDVIINTTSFSQHIEGNASLSSDPQFRSNHLFKKNIPIIQAVMASNSVEDWLNNSQGLRARDIIMNIALPEYDGRIISRAISFKTLIKKSKKTQIDIIRYQLHTERANFVSELAYRWALLKYKDNKEKRIAMILANYPNKDSRIGNGVGLDTPASIINILKKMKQSGYNISGIPKDGDSLIRILRSGVTNNTDQIEIKSIFQSLDISDYQNYFKDLPEENQQLILDRWGKITLDPKYRDGKIIISGIQLGSIFIGIQPARGYNVDLSANYHDPDLVPPHSYLAFYFWLRYIYGADAISHVGKHGNLEWLPGKSVALSEGCWPDLILGPCPHIYPFIVNDPGEGTQAKRRAQTVILDHLIPPMARAENYGDLQELERLVDEFYQAIGIDSRRENYLRQNILSVIQKNHIQHELNLENQKKINDEEILNQLDTYLCELKESQIRNGLHRFGEPPSETLNETLVSLTRLPRGKGKYDLGLLHCLCQDLNLRNDTTEIFDPIHFNPSKLWKGNKPEILKNISTDCWRIEADTRERLELLAETLVNNAVKKKQFPESMTSTQHILQYISEVILVAIRRCSDELSHFIQALDGKFIPAGPSGAPTRGRLDVLPTGRNFYSLDSRSIPTQSAWELGQQSAEQLVVKHMQEHGDYPKQIGISVWGTSTMRTGGDDIAQAMSLIGVRPVWIEHSNKVVDFEVIPGFQLNRPRVDVTLRISGFFRDAFPNVIKLFDTAVKTLANHEEPGNTNTIRQNIESEKKVLIDRGSSIEQAESQSNIRIFGSKPGSYGAGLQGLINARIWDNKEDLAKSYINWGGYSYSCEKFGEAAFQIFENRLSQLEAVVQNQDNREHDLLDSDDYYQFQGGMANAVTVLKGESPAIYHGDHSDPSNPKIRTLKEEINRVIRSRVINPKWISAMQKHGYKGALEMAASVDYLFAYDATTGLVNDYQYELITDSLILDDNNQKFLKQKNPNAFKDMTERLLEAQQRGMWKKPGLYNRKIVNTILDVDNTLERTSFS